MILLLRSFAAIHDFCVHTPCKEGLSPKKNLYKPILRILTGLCLIYINTYK